MTAGARSFPTTSVLAASVSLAQHRLGAPGRARAIARSDEDALTLAAEAAGPLLAKHRPAAVIFVSSSPPYAGGGSVQPLLEFLGLDDEVFAVELGGTPRDGTAALGLAAALAAAGQGPVLVCASHAHFDRRDAGAGAVALTVGSGDGGAGTYRLERSLAQELRDEWVLAGAARANQAERTFLREIATERRAEELAGEDPAGPVLVCGPDPKAAAAVERRLGGPGDTVRAAAGDLGAAHALARLVEQIETPHTLLNLGAGFADVVSVTPGPGAEESAGRLRAALAAEGREIAAPEPISEPDDFHPYASDQLSWRDRGQNYRLEGIRSDGTEPPAIEPALGTVVTWVRDYVYPAAEMTDMAIVDLDGGGRFYGQVARGHAVEIGDRVCLRPRRLHHGDGGVQYFWKVGEWR